MMRRIALVIAAAAAALAFTAGTASADAWPKGDVSPTNVNLPKGGAWPK